MSVLLSYKPGKLLEFIQYKILLSKKDIETETVSLVGAKK